MHWVIDGALFGREVMVAAFSILVADRMRRLPGSVRTVRGRWHLRHGKPDFIWIPPSHRDLPGGLGDRFPARPADPFTGQSW